jgi:hypothetical protein
MKIANADLKSTGGKLSLGVTAIAPTSGWTNVNLAAVEYIHPPEDGLQDIILSATAPSGPATTVIETFELSIPLNAAAWFLGVRIKNAAGDENWELRNPTLNHAPIGNNGFAMELAEIREDKLAIHVRYGGGCRQHSFQLNWDGSIMESFPPQVILELSHNNHGDNCMALLSDTLQFDLSTLEGFPAETTDLIISFPGGGTTIRYTPPVTNAVEAAKTLIIPLPVVKRGFSNSFDFAEAMKNAMTQIPDRGAGIPDFLAHYTVKKIGAEVGGIAGLNRLFVDVEG